MEKIPRFGRFPLVITIWSLSCATPEDGAPAPWAESTSHPIINGSLVAPDESGFAFVASPTAGCTAVLLSNDWALTAKHCFERGEEADPGSVRLFMGAQDKVAKEVLLHPTEDIALVRLAEPFRMNGATSGFSKLLFQGTQEDLRGEELECFGYGVSVPPLEEAGSLRTARLVADNGTFGWFVVHQNGLGQRPYFGDSGGSCELVRGGQRFVAAVMVNIWDLSTDTRVIPAASFRQWVADARMPHEIIAQHSEKCLDLPPNGDHGALLTQWGCHGGANQRWRFVPTYWDLFMMRAQHSGKCLAVSTGDNEDRVLQVSCDYEDRKQRWAIRHTGLGWLELRSDWGGRCLDVWGWARHDDAELTVYDCHGGTNQRFRAPLWPERPVELAPIGGGGELCLDAGGLNDGSIVTQQTCRGAANQRFRAEAFPGTHTAFRFVAQHSGRCLARFGPGSSPAVQQIGCAADWNQLFQPTFAVDGAMIRTPGNLRCLSVSPANATMAGASLLVSPCDTSGPASQRFRAR